MLIGFDSDYSVLKYLCVGWWSLNRAITVGKLITLCCYQLWITCVDLIGAASWLLLTVSAFSFFSFFFFFKKKVIFHGLKLIDVCVGFSSYNLYCFQITVVCNIAGWFALSDAHGILHLQLLLLSHSYWILNK